MVFTIFYNSSIICFYDFYKLNLKRKLLVKIKSIIFSLKKTMYVQYNFKKIPEQHYILNIQKLQILETDAFVEICSINS